MLVLPLVLPLLLPLVLPLLLTSILEDNYLKLLLLTSILYLMLLIPEADLKWLVLPLFLTLIPEAAHKLLVLLMLEADLRQLVLLLVLSEDTFYLMSMSCPIIETWYLIEPMLLNNIRLLTSM